MGLQAELLDSPAKLERIRTTWDALAVERGRPYCAPGWMLSWLRTVAPRDALVRACVVREGSDLVAVAPFWTRDADGRYGLLGERTSSPVEPIALAGREAEACAAIADLLAHARPRPRTLELKGAPAGSQWPRLLAEARRGTSPASVSRTRVEKLPQVSLRHANAEEWLATKSRNFRQQMRRGRRQLEEAGATFRISSPGEVERDVVELARLHHARWRARGGSRALDADVEAMLELAGRDLPHERFRLLSIDVGGRSISAHLFVSAGPVCAYWLGGFDERWAAARPSMQALVVAVELAIGHGEKRIELGPGGQDYKYRLADVESELEWLTIASPFD